MKRLATALVAAAAAGLAAVLIWRGFAPRAADADVLSGYIEGQPLYLSAPIAGAVTFVGVVDGQRVEPGAPLFAIDPQTLSAERDQAQAQLDEARVQAMAARATLRQQAASLAAATIQLAAAARDAARYRGLSASSPGAASAQDVDRSLTASANAKAQRDAAVATVGNAALQAQAAEAATAHARAALNEAQARLDQLSVRAPAGGRVEQVYYQKGEWAAANQAIVSLIPDDKVKVRFFAPAADMALYRPGVRLRFTCDACPGALAARVVYVSPAAEYTPPVIYSRQARDRLVFEVEALPDDPRGLDPGLPVDVVPLGHGRRAGR